MNKDKAAGDIILHTMRGAYNLSKLGYRKLEEKKHSQPIMPGYAGQPFRFNDPNNLIPFERSSERGRRNTDMEIWYLYSLIADTHRQTNKIINTKTEPMDIAAHPYQSKEK